jgi:hydroxymethylbilane synthase
VKLRVGTRGSRLALVQTESVAGALAAAGAEVELVRITTSGDRLAQVALAEFGGKALFVKEIEEALLNGRIDVAVHSLKDMPAVLPAGLTLGAFPTRADPGDVLVTRAGGDLAGLAPGSVVGTSSLRRRVLLLGRRPDLEVRPIRGNVDTRLAKLGAGAVDALVLARAGLDRLGLSIDHAVALPVADFVPAVGQGLLAVEVRQDDQRALEVVGRLDDTRCRMEALAERAFLHGLGADCHTPVAGHARGEGDRLRLHGLVASLDGRTVIRASVEGAGSEAEALGRGLAAEMLGRGAGALLAAGGEAAR